MQLFVGKRRLSSYAPLSVDVLTVFAAAQRTPFAVAKDQDTQKVQSQLVDEDSWLLWTVMIELARSCQQIMCNLQVQPVSASLCRAAAQRVR